MSWVGYDAWFTHSCLFGLLAVVPYSSAQTWRGRIRGFYYRQMNLFQAFCNMCQLLPTGTLSYRLAISHVYLPENIKNKLIYC